jgi:hypothetical protein
MIQAKIEDLIGKTIKSIDSREDSITFNTEEGESYSMFHYQDCCENVTIEEIVGSLDDLIGVPILKAEERTNVDRDPVSVNAESYTWTFL